MCRHLSETPSRALTVAKDDLCWFLQVRQTVAGGDLAGLSVAVWYRTPREAFRRPIFDELSLEWRHVVDVALTRRSASAQPPTRSVGTPMTELLPFDSSQFGSLPVVA